MKWSDVRAFARQSLATIRSGGLHGCENRVPGGYLRGIEHLGTSFDERFGVSTLLYFRNHGVLPDLVAPETFTEKQVLFKFFGLVPALCPSDKLNSARFLAARHRDLTAVPVRIWKSRRPVLPEDDAIPPGRYYFKSNHGSGTHRAVVFPLEADQRPQLARLARRWLTRTHSERRALWWYETMERFVYLEEDLSDGSTDVPDWKFFVCHGRVELFQVDTNRHGDHVQTIYARSGAFLDRELYFKSGTPVEMPPFLDQMVEVAEGIGERFDFIRVDMFVKGGRFYLGEIGLVPNGATIAIRSRDLDLRLGAAWQPPWLGKVDAGYSGGHYGQGGVGPA